MTAIIRGDLKEPLAAAALVLLESGTGNRSLRAVARAAGVLAMAPYRHFADKAALRAAVAQCGFAARHDTLAADDRAFEPRAALWRKVTPMSPSRARPALFRLMFRDQLGLAKPAREDTAPYDMLARRGAELAPGDAESAALACWSIVHGLATLALDGRPAGLDPDQERRALALFVAGLGRPGGE